MPDWLQSEMGELSHLEFHLNTEEANLAKFEHFVVGIKAASGKKYRELLSVIPKTRYDYVLIAPWIKLGGADLAILHHLSYLSRHGKDVLLVLTEPELSTRLDRVPGEVDILEFGRHVNDLMFDEQRHLLDRLLIEFAPDVIHVVNSRLGWYSLKVSGTAISSVSDVYVSLYCDDIDSAGCPVGYGREFLVPSFPYIKRVITDNSVYVETLRKAFGLPKEKFAVVRLPTDEKLLELEVDHSDKSQDILWCGRLDAQKRPELLVQISRLLPNVNFHVYGQVVTGNNNDIARELIERPNIKLHEPFDRFIDVAREYRVILNTSAWDGLPNILVEAAAAGLLIITSDVGGISDLVTQTTGYVVVNHSEPGEYVKCIEACLEDPAKSLEKVVGAREQIKKHHTRLAFDRSMTELLEADPVGHLLETV
ncbi:glycosyltransferase family 4 protein [Microbulbifer agarilyticus]|uniref:glycosyltransferase family 4 protein n=1 Tax=Microbulbifer agarilyticus TaxID=260552 RepID=UPI001C951966|nr:glycosyltransferase family 4 protein [Microbulbifer agarilyticus]MBY6189165.1 glycosyltransferase family 4 protein [Microbulbifer agarilyticus]